MTPSREIDRVIAEKVSVQEKEAWLRFYKEDGYPDLYDKRQVYARAWEDCAKTMVPVKVVEKIIEKCRDFDEKFNKKYYPGENWFPIALVIKEALLEYEEWKASQKAVGVEK